MDAAGGHAAPPAALGAAGVAGVCPAAISGAVTSSLPSSPLPFPSSNRSGSGSGSQGPDVLPGATLPPLLQSVLQGLLGSAWLHPQVLLCLDCPDSHSHYLIPLGQGQGQGHREQ